MAMVRKEVNLVRQSSRTKETMRRAKLTAKES